MGSEHWKEGISESLNNEQVAEQRQEQVQIMRTDFNKEWLTQIVKDLGKNGQHIGFTSFEQ